MAKVIRWRRVKYKILRFFQLSLFTGNCAIKMQFCFIFWRVKIIEDEHLKFKLMKLSLCVSEEVSFSNSVFSTSCSNSVFFFIIAEAEFLRFLEKFQDKLKMISNYFRRLFCLKRRLILSQKY